ncbi:hypothetical protein [Rheinheimera sp. MMS21-TC3]|uniref:hypothetical protein n=1 Tax=Rheinheimera sp. MMS21-TC3 TaxID=3072790 RepID=UPI0028C4D48D|nr:hypothetical protein [Rheinheimera sp. MMS21-TC3]WNO60455.1 hypothetical protein RDV63_05675 [Rheinheimera sp. MMS21-TC3]
MSLLLGFGRGLSQASGMLAAGMQEDRQVARQKEIEAMREASIERRWARDVALRQSERAEDKELRASERAEDMSFRQSESNRQAGQFDRQQTVREKQVIEGNLEGIMQQEARSADKIRQAYDKQMQSGMGDPQLLTEQYNEAIKKNSEFFSEQLNNMVKSYGSQLQGTGYEYLLSAQAAEEENRDPDNITGTETQGSNELSDYIKQWNLAKPKSSQPSYLPKKIEADPIKAKLMPQIGLIDGVGSRDFQEFSSWLKK